MTLRIVTAEERQRAAVVRVLEAALAEARAGKISQVLVVGWRGGHWWTHWLSECPTHAEIVGKLQIVMQGLVRHYF